MKLCEIVIVASGKGATLIGGQSSIEILNPKSMLTNETVTRIQERIANERPDDMKLLGNLVGGAKCDSIKKDIEWPKDPLCEEPWFTKGQFEQHMRGFGKVSCESQGAISGGNCLISADLPSIKTEFEI
ncbi:hypothetical protein ACQKQC_06060 [Vibrio fortis]|uniref:hypothetical protein n=1 Tax=Vibrio fortis TaxID=212667 RepID=UPI0040690BDC